jgi:Tfp pilus assembly protein PilF
LIPGRGDAEFEREDATRLAENALGRRLSPREVSRYWTGRALSFIRNDTSKWLTLMSRKCCLIANRVEIVDTEDVYAYADFSWTLWLAVPVFQFGFLSALAAGGIVIDGQETRRSNVLIACILAYSGSVILFYVAARYRLPLVPLLIPFAVNGLLASPQFLRRATMPWRAAYIFAVVGMLIASHWKIVDPGRMRAQSYYNFATHFERSGDVRLAVDHYRVALSLNPEHAEAHFNLGNCLAHSRAFEGAKREYEAALALQPGLAAAALNLGNVYCEQGRFQKAMAYFERTLAIEPENARAHNGLGMISAAEGNMVEAIQHFERAILYEPQFKAAYQNLLRAREGQHRPEGK